MTDFKSEMRDLTDFLWLEAIGNGYEDVCKKKFLSSLLALIEKKMPKEKEFYEMASKETNTIYKSFENKGYLKGFNKVVSEIKKEMGI